MKENEDNNIVTITGIIYRFFQFSHQAGDEKFYKSEIVVHRFDGEQDNVPVMISEKLMGDPEEYIGKKVRITGQFRSFSEKPKNSKKCRMHLYVMIGSLERIYGRIMCELPNMIFVDGHVCASPLRRRTPMGKDIADVIVAVDRKHGKSDYLPCILWGENAIEAEGMPVGSRLRLWGRIQSRDYEKKLSDEVRETRTAYEVSVGRVQRVLPDGEEDI